MFSQEENVMLSRLTLKKKKHKKAMPGYFNEFIPVVLLCACLLSFSSFSILHLFHAS